MRKFLIVLAVLVVLVLAAPFVILPLVGLSATDLKANVEVGAGLGAKLACSGHHVSGMSPQQAQDDLLSYTPAADMFTLEFDDVERSVTASLFGLGATTARYRDGIGCSLEIGDTSILDNLRTPDLVTTQGVWPAGEADNVVLQPVQDRIEAILQQDNASGLQTRALLVVQHGRVVAETYAPGFDSATPLLGWSMGKTLTAIMLGHMEYLGQLSVDEVALFPAWQDDARKLISIEHLLRMSSGLDFDEVYAPGSDATAMLFTAHSASDVAIASQAAHPPGTHFSYSSGTTNMLARLLTEKLGGPQAAIDFLWQRIFRPLGMTHSIFEVDPSGVLVGSSYIYASARDWARLGQLLLNDGQWQGERLLREDFVTRAQKPNSSANDPRYGYQVWLNGGGEQLRWPPLPADAYAMNGNRAQTVMMVPSADAVLVRLGWTSGRYPLANNFAAILEELDN